MRIWFALHWAESVPLTEPFTCNVLPPFIPDGMRGAGRAPVSADALILWTLEEGFYLWDYRKDLPGGSLQWMAAKYHTAVDLVQVSRKWKWQDVVPEHLWLHVSVDLYSTINRRLAAALQAQAQPPAQPPQEGEQSHE